EILTTLALTYLSQRCDRLVIEVGMGGRLDATNVLDLGIAVITNVALDHQRYLGESIEKIATEKAGIIKPGNLVITGAEGAALEVVEASAGAAGARRWRPQPGRPGLAGGGRVGARGGPAAGCRLRDDGRQGHTRQPRRAAPPQPAPGDLHRRR